MDSFGELLTAMVTPFDDKLELDLEKARELATYLEITVQMAWLSWVQQENPLP